ncbi:MAG: glycoside hydrolase family 52 protein [Puniceicoccales bacterium]
MTPLTLKSNFNAHHSPVGAFASFTLGKTGPHGGLGLELGKPADENIFIGLQCANGEGYETLPFYAGGDDESTRYDVGVEPMARKQLIRPFASGGIQRTFNLGTDQWTAGDLSFTIYTPHPAVPDPATASDEELAAAVVPAIIAEITVDNHHGNKDRTVFIGYTGSDPYSQMRRIDDLAPDRLSGVAQGNRTALACVAGAMTAALGFTIDACLEPDHPENIRHGLGGTGALKANVGAGEKKSFRIAICFHRDGVPTSGLPCRYFYNRYFESIESVAEYALKNWEQQQGAALALDERLDAAQLNADRKFMLAHAVRSYFGSTQFLEHEGKPFWVVNEGEYRMMNTFDLTVDHLFFELDRNPWVVRNQLDWFIHRYSYCDQVRLPGDDTEYPGGISFTHDMGMTNHVSRPGFSTYECFGLHGCFSHMTHEQLVNWVCCAVSYFTATGDQTWITQNLSVFEDCLTSLINRDHPDPSQRDGVMDADSSRCDGGSEITTYDSLDTSLGQARRNLYLAVKSWAAYLGIEQILASNNKSEAATNAHTQAVRCAATIVAHQQPDGSLPAILEPNNASRIIPAIEGLVFPNYWRMRDQLNPQGEFGELMQALNRHHQAILEPGVCLFENGGWKLSSTNDNSWLSKIYLCQHVAEQVLHLPSNPTADTAHREWLLRPENTYFAWSDQMVAGVAKGSKYYPRGVTSWLWLNG